MLVVTVATVNIAGLYVQMICDNIDVY